jgi:uncharacterized membrane protein
MQVDVTILGVVFSAVSTLVVIVGGVAALRQLRYLRHGNELSTLNELEAHWHRDDLESAREFVVTELPAAMNDPTFLDELRAEALGPRALHLSRIGNFFELMGMYVFVGALSERSVMLMWMVVIERYWVLCREAIQITREPRGFVYGFFEDLAMRTPRWRDKDATGWRRALRRDPALTSRAPGIPSTEP